MFDHRIVARSLLSFVCASQGLATFAIDLNRTHATNPLWVKHARFHVVWQSVSVFLLSLMEVGLIWWPGSGLEQRFYLCVALAGVPMLGFLVASIFIGSYNGALSDHNGILPLRVRIFGKVLDIDLNLSVEIVSLLILGTILTIYNRQ